LVAADAVLVRVGLGEEVEAVLGEGELVVRNMVCMFSFSPSSAFMVAAAPSIGGLSLRFFLSFILEVGDSCSSPDSAPGDTVGLRRRLAGEAAVS